MRSELGIEGLISSSVGNEFRSHDSHERMIVSRETRQEFPPRRFDTPANPLLQLSVPSTNNQQ
jgi:hypothetical protein